MTVRHRYTARYDYPGALFPEEVTKEIPAGTLEAALAAAPDGDPAESWFGAKDGWYALHIHKITEKRFLDPDSPEETWVRQGEPERVARYVFGQKVHADDIEETDRTRILIANIRGNSREPLKDIGVHTRAGNWQIASDYDEVIDAPVPARAFS